MSDKNILVIIMDSVRSKNFGLLQNGRENTKNINELAEDSTVYTNARSPSIWSVPSHASIFTGKYVFQHNVKTSEDYLKKDYTIASKLNDSYDTALFSSNPYLVRLNVGLDNGFDEVYNKESVLFSNGLNPNDFLLKEENSYKKFLKKSLEEDVSATKSILNGISEKIK